jgi:outer membrane immunogenic protein
MAADMPVLEPIAVVEVPLFTWTGGYIGVQGGYAWADGELSDGTDIVSDDFNGGLFGGYIGYNWQFNSFVFGGEADVNALWNDTTYVFPNFDVEVGSNYLASIRARAGYAWDRTLLFATGGVAFTEVSADTSFGVDASESFTGWTIGGGVEHAFTDNIVGRAEYRYYDFGNQDVGAFEDVDFQTQTVTVGLAYKF